MISILNLLFSPGLIHANHGGEMTDYLLNQLKDATTDVSAILSTLIFDCI